MRNTMRNRTKFTLAAALALGLVSQTAKAAITNGDFSGSPDLTGWVPTGDVSRQNADYNPAFPALTAGVVTTRFGNPISGTPALEGTGIATLDTNAGLAAGTLEALNVKSGSLVTQTFSATAGDVVNFNYNFITNEPVAGGNPDFAFYTLRAQNGTTIIQMLPLATPPGATQLPNQFFVDPHGQGRTEQGIIDFGSSPGVTKETGNLNGTTTPIGTTGLWTLTFGVVNVNDDKNDSGLIVTNVAEGAAVTVPLPTAAYVAPLGLLLAVGYSLKLRSKAVTA